MAVTCGFHYIAHEGEFQSVYHFLSSIYQFALLVKLSFLYLVFQCLHSYSEDKQFISR